MRYYPRQEKYLYFSSIETKLLRGNEMAQTTAQRNRVQALDVMTYIAATFNHMRNDNATAAEYIAQRKSIQSRINELKTSRDRNACHNMLEAQSRVMYSGMMTLGYKYNGEIYTVLKDSVPNCKTSNELHDLSLPMEEWDKMERFNVWIHSGAIYGQTMMWGNH